MSAYYRKLQEKSRYFLFINECTWRNITESRDRWNFKSLQTLFVICTCDTTFSALLLQENYALVFSQSEACNFFMYIIKHCNNLVKVFKMSSWSHLKHLYIEEIKSNPQVYTTLESITDFLMKLEWLSVWINLKKLLKRFCLMKLFVIINSDILH